MFQKENALIDRFTTGLTALAGNLKLKNRIRYQDDNITAEQFICRLMNILYDMDYRSDNGTDGLTAGYDLISERKKEVLQVSSTRSGDKIDDACDKTRNAIQDGKLERNAYTLRFIFLTNDASNLKTCAAAKRAEKECGYSFNPNRDILDFTVFAAQVKTEFQFVPERADRLRRFMDYCSDVFPPDMGEASTRPTDRVGKIIDEYAGNFEAPLFMHLYTDPPVTLKDLYVDPSFYGDGINQFSLYESGDMQGYLRQYLQDKMLERDRFLFIEGSAAIGKTSLVSWLCWHYRNRTDIGKSIFSDRQIVCIRLRELDFIENTINVQVVLDYLNVSDLDEFEKRYRDAVLILDGADELSMVSGISHGSVEEFLLKLQRKFYRHKFIVTTRPQFLDMRQFQSSRFYYRHITLSHYNPDMRWKWLDKYKACGQSVPDNTESFIRNLKGSEENGIADTPLALYLLVQCDAKEDLLGNSWALFNKIFSEAITKGDYNSNFYESGDLLDARQSSINYRVVQSIAFRMFRNASKERYYLNSTEIDEAIGECNLEGATVERVRETCVLCAYWKNVDTLGALEFYHNNIRDFFLCEYLCEQLIDCMNDPEPMERLIPMLCRVLCHADICGSTWKQVYEYLCLRLDYESIKPRTAQSLYYLVQDKHEVLAMAMGRLAAGQELWNIQTDMVPYLSAKRLFANALMLLRILNSFHPKKIDFVSAGSFSEFRAFIKLFHDWSDVLNTNPIRYTDHLSQQKIIDVTSATNYTKLDLSEKYMRDLTFNDSYFYKPYFDYSRIHRTCFREAVIIKGYFNDCVMEESSFEHSEICNIKLHNARFDNTSFSHTLLSLWDSRQCRFERCHFLQGTKIIDCVLYSESFDNTEFKNVEIKKSDWTGSGFASVNIRNSKFTETIMKRIRFDGTIFNTTFVECSFHWSSFKRQDTFQNVTFQSCFFDGVSFRGMDLSSVKFIDCDLNFAIFDNPPQ